MPLKPAIVMTLACSLVPAQTAAAAVVANVRDLLDAATYRAVAKTGIGCYACHRKGAPSP